LPSFIFKTKNCLLGPNDVNLPLIWHHPKRTSKPNFPNFFIRN